MKKNIVISIICLLIFIPILHFTSFSSNNRHFSTSVNAKVSVPVERTKLVVDFNFPDQSIQTASINGSSEYEVLINNLRQIPGVMFSESSSQILGSTPRFEYRKAISIEISDLSSMNKVETLFENSPYSQIIQTLFIPNETTVNTLLYEEATRLAREKANAYAATTNKLVGRVKRVNELPSSNLDDGNLLSFYDESGQLFVEVPREFSFTFGTW